MLRADGCLVTPGLVNTHHHIYQNLTAGLPARDRRRTSSTGCTDAVPAVGRLDEEAAYLSAWIGLAELALGGCTTSTDHLYVHPRGGGDLISAEITRRERARHAVPPDPGLDEPVAEGRRAAARLGRAGRRRRSSPTPSGWSALHHDRVAGAMVRVALAPCSPFSVTPELMRRTAELAERLDVRLHTHLAEDPDEDTFCLETFGCRADRALRGRRLGHRPHVGRALHLPERGRDRPPRAWGTGVAHCPSSNMMIGGGGIAPVAELPRRRGAGRHRLRRLVVDRLGVALDGGPQRAAARPPARRPGVDAAPATRSRSRPAGGAGCLGRERRARRARRSARSATWWCWPLEGVAFAGALSDPVEAWLRCGPVAARHTVVAGRAVVEDGALVSAEVEEMLAWHRRAAERIQVN